MVNIGYFRSFLMIMGLSAMAVYGPQAAHGQESADEQPVFQLNGVQVFRVWARPTLVPGQPTAVYLTITNSTRQDVRLTSVTAAGAQRTEMHDNIHEDGIVRMVRMKDLVIPSGIGMKFKPGGKHIMVFGLADMMKTGMRLPLTLSFEGAGDIEVEAVVSSDMADPFKDEDHGH